MGSLRLGFGGMLGPGAEAFKRDLPDAEIHRLDAGHSAPDKKNDDIASLALLAKRVGTWRGCDHKSKATLTGA